MYHTDLFQPVDTVNETRLFMFLSRVRLLTTKSEIALDNPALSLDSNLEQLVRVENVHSTGHEGEVVAAAGNGELADEDARGVPAVVEKVSLARRRYA
jgi:hypothetical protein